MRSQLRMVDKRWAIITIVIIAHRLSTIRNCDRIYVMSSGTVIESGTFDELVADEDSRFHTLAEVQRL